MFDTRKLSWIARALVLGMGFLCLGTPGALAQDNAAKRDRLLDQVGEALGQKNYANAIPKMRALYALSPEPSVLFNIGVAYEKWGDHCPQALKAFDDFMEACGTCAQRSTGELRAKALRQTCGPGRLELKSAPRAIAVEIDGKDRGETPLTVELAPGAHILKIAGDDGSTMEQQIYVGPDTHQELSMTLAAQGGAGPSVMGTKEKVGWYLMGGSLAAFTAVGLTLISENGKYQEYQEELLVTLNEMDDEKREASKARSQSLDDEASGLKNIAQISSIVGAILGATGAYLVLSSRLSGPAEEPDTSARRKAPASPSAWSVQIGPGAIGIQGVFP